MPVLPAGKVGQEKGHGACADFLMPTAFGVITTRSRPLALVWVGNRKLRTRTPSPRVNMIAPEIFRFFGRIPNSSSICKGLPIYEPYGNISERAYSGKISVQWF